MHNIRRTAVYAIRTYGGVGGGSCKASSYPDWTSLIPRIFGALVIGSAVKTTALRRPGTAAAHVAPQPRDQLLDDLLVGRAERRFPGGCRFGLLFDVAQHVDQHLGRAQLGRSRFVDELGDHRLAPAGVCRFR